MEETNLDIDVEESTREQTPLNDTSGEESSGEVLKGEAYIETVERLHDGSSHLLLHIEGNNSELMDSSIRGKYRYRLKRIGPLGDWVCVTEEKDTIKSKSKKLIKSVLRNSIEKLNESSSDKSDSSEESADKKKSLPARLPSGRELPSVSEKRKLFENKSQSPKVEEPASRSRKPTVRKNKSSSDESQAADKPSKVSDMIRQINKKEDEASEEEDEEEEDEEEEIIVSKENTVTKLIREKQKKIDQVRTVVLEERFTIEAEDVPRKEAVLNVDPDVESSDEELSALSKQLTKQGNSLLEREDKEKSYIDLVTRITTEKHGSNKPSSTETITQRKRLEPKLHRAEAGDEKLLEKLKPEESIQYEYEQVIEQPESAVAKSNGDGKFMPRTETSTESTKVENITTKTTKKQTKEKFEKTEQLTPAQLKKTITDLTTYLTEDEEDKIVETLEKSKRLDEFSYQQFKNKGAKHSAHDMDAEELALMERITPNQVDNAGFDNELVKITASRQFEFVADGKPFAGSDEQNVMFYAGGTDGDEATSRATFQESSSGENIYDYYNLKPAVDLDAHPGAENRFFLKPIDLNTLTVGEQFKPDEITLFVDNNKMIKSNMSEERTESEGESDEKPMGTYYEPIENLTAEDFFRVKHKTPPPKSLDLIKAKFERKSSTDSDNELKRARSEDNRFLSGADSRQPAKLPKSKMEIYDKDFKLNLQFESKIPKHKSLASRKSSNEDEATTTTTTSSEELKSDKAIKKKQLQPHGLKARSPLSHESSEDSPVTSRTAKSRIPVVSPVDPDLNEQHRFKLQPRRSSSEISRKMSSEDENSIYKRPDKLAPNEKSIRKLRDMYEKREEAPDVPVLDKIKKLPKQSLSLFDKAEEAGVKVPPGKKPESHEVKKSPTSTVIETEQKDKPLTSVSPDNEKPKNKLLKSFLDQYESIPDTKESLSTGKPPKSTDYESKFNQEAPAAPGEKIKKLSKSFMDQQQDHEANKTPSAKIPSTKLLKKTDSSSPPSSDKDEVFERKSRPSKSSEDESRAKESDKVKKISKSYMDQYGTGKTDVVDKEPKKLPKEKLVQYESKEELNATATPKKKAAPAIEQPVEVKQEKPTSPKQVESPSDPAQKGIKHLVHKYELRTPSPATYERKASSSSSDSNSQDNEKLKKKSIPVYQPATTAKKTEKPANTDKAVSPHVDAHLVDYKAVNKPDESKEDDKQFKKLLDRYEKILPKPDSSPASAAKKQEGKEAVKQVKSSESDGSDEALSIPTGTRVYKSKHSPLIATLHVPDTTESEAARKQSQGI